MNARGRVRLGYRALFALFGCRQSFRRAYLRHRGDLVRLASTRWAERRDHAWDAAKLGPAGGALRKR